MPAAKKVQQSNSSNQDERPPIQAITDIESEYPNEWVMIEVTKMAKDGYTALEGRLMAHGTNYEAVGRVALDYIKKYNVKGTYSNYLGEITAEAVLL